jgi:hypothetical protein
MDKKTGTVEKTRDARRTERKSVLNRAMVVVANGTVKIPCTIRDLSATGARIELARAVDLPAIVHLIDVPNHMAYEAAIARRQHPVYGLNFIQALPLRKPTTPLFLRKLWFDHLR